MSQSRTIGRWEPRSAPDRDYLLWQFEHVTFRVSAASIILSKSFVLAAL